MWLTRGASVFRGMQVTHRNWIKRKTACNYGTTTGEGRITIDDVTKELKTAKNPELVPQKYVSVDETGAYALSQTALHHLRWMMQKDNLKQDMFLLGQPGPLRRTLAMQYLQLTQRELEYIALSRDTTESDLKQRREIKDKAAVYFDQCAVRAAVHGRILILDGVEHAERNVLPILNNLLENREMHLENGKFLMSPERYDKLLQTYSKEELDKWGLLRVSEDFRVIALGLPTQKYKGTPLDPPLRSRFQSRNVSHYSYSEVLRELHDVAPNLEASELQKLVSFGMAVLASDSTSSLPDFPIDNLRSVAQMMDSNPAITVHEALLHLYPYKTLLPRESQDQITTLFDSLKIPITPHRPIKSIEVTKTDSDLVDFQIDGHTIAVNGGPKKIRKTEGFIDIDYQRSLLSSMIQMYAVGDICLIGPKGVGKSALSLQLVNWLGQSIEPMVLYEDMTSRDLIQQRVTTLDGDTIWRDSPLVRAAKTGSVAILDGIDRLHKSTITVLQRLIHDRELQLCDGNILVRRDRYEELLKTFSARELFNKGILPIHKSFKIIALADPPNVSSSNNWLTPEILSLFLFLEIRPLHATEEMKIINKLYSNLDENIQKVVKLSHILRESKDPMMQSLSTTLSTRQLIKIAHRMSVYPPAKEGESSLNSVYEIVQNAFLAKFLPALPRAALESAMERAGVHKPSAKTAKQKSIEVEGDVLRIGNTSYTVVKTEAESKVPSTLFYDVPQHVEILERLLQDFMIGEHLLLVGNQGVGKNKLVDKLLSLMHRPREYLQLHRDTTVHSLTVQSSLRDGMVVFEDSPLVKAVKSGHVLVIDEADKAPVNVTCILRTLVENGEMTLSDGRKIVPYGMEVNTKDADKVIQTHRDFRVIVLANRPGFPFLGNDFFASLGDVFSCIAIDNPSPSSEIFLLQQYGPSVPKTTLSTLVNAFGELRTMADEGLLNYPYSTREVVNIVKHLEKFPNESMSELVGNVLDFDKYSPEVLDQVTQVLLKHGLAIETYAKNELAKERKKREIQMTVERKSGLDVSQPKHGKVDPKNEPHVGGNTWAGGTGGRDTAGLGGKGGPYRLDAGHTVHQLSDAEKDDIPEEVKLAAREMNRKAFADKLKEIQMTAYDHSVYEQFSAPIRRQVQQLKAILSALQTKSKERLWQKYQTAGELDDTRLIEGITGEKNIYRRRADVNPFADQVQEKPKRLRLIVDVSGSMYRFNGYDGRLDRELEAVVMVMEAFEGFESKIVYDIIGHSGESPNIPFVQVDKTPKTDKDRLETIKMMHAHSQYCWSGDHTLAATHHSIDSLSKEDHDDSIVIVLSDANLRRYNINPKKLSEILKMGEPKVQAYVIFIGSLSEEAEIINSKMPAGHGFVCMDLTKLPQILKQIFTSSIV